MAFGAGLHAVQSAVAAYQAKFAGRTAPMPLRVGLVEPLTTGQGRFAPFARLSVATSRPRVRLVLVQVAQRHVQYHVHHARAYQRQDRLD